MLAKALITSDRSCFADLFALFHQNKQNGLCTCQDIFAENLSYLKEAIAILQVEPEEREKLSGQLEKLSQLLDDTAEEEECPGLI